MKEHYTGIGLMSESLTIGKWGESFAKKYLEHEGLIFITANFQCKMGEIDIIMQHDNFLVFVEVRVRNTILHGNPLESITYAKQRKVRKTAEFYLQKTHHTKEARIDVIGIDTSKEPPKITWIQNAF